ncbi:lipase family protein [Chitinophaga qingshengii]|uniref:Lipase family protein n=1 Tax=Chitinophaga qingshengii TaxID=1569794 RepID=A0ABR7TIB5_9BACT|nr:lipase family protein [Chitinophaga qingshengii]MBC9929730.1 lipase family protein [Chitinophaga qingshengii]
METEVQSLAVSLSEAVKYAKITNLADILFKQAVLQKDKATQLNPSLQAYQDICDNTAFQSLVDQDFFTNYNLLYNIQMNDIIAPGAGLDLVYYGFIAQNKTTKEYVVAIRGTENLLEAIADSFFVPTAFKEFNNNAVVPAGFYDLYESGLVVSPPDSPLQVIPLLLPLLAADPTALMPDVMKVRTVVNGHSLGASLATYLAAALAVGKGQGMDLCVYTYASPLSGNAAFAATYNDSVKVNYRIHNLPDGVPSLPQFPLNGPNIYVPVAGGYQIDSSKYPQVKPGAGCAHQLPVYQYTLDRLNGIDNPDILNFNKGNCKA